MNGESELTHKEVDKLIQDQTLLFDKVFQNQMIIPEFDRFSKEIEKPMLDILLDIDKKFSKNSLLKLKKRKKIALIIIK